MMKMIMTVQAVTVNSAMTTNLLNYRQLKRKRSSALGKPLHAIKSFKSNYPERMKRVYMCNPPSYFSVFWALAKPFIDPVTRDKVVSSYG